MLFPVNLIAQNRKKKNTIKSGMIQIKKEPVDVLST